MTRRVLAVVLLAACSTKGSAPAAPPAAPSGANPAAPAAPRVDDLVWTGSDGDLVARAHDGKLEGACGPIGTYTDTAITYPRGTVSYAEITAKDGTYTPPGMTFHFELAPSGALTTVHDGGKREPAGTITGVTDDAAKQRVRALLAGRMLAGPPQLSIELDGKVVFRYDDGRVVDPGRENILYDDKPPMEDPFWVARDARVVHSGDHYDVDLDAPHDNTYRALHYTVTEKPLGTLAFGDKPFATIPDRVACKAEDRQVTSLLRALLLSDPGLQYLRLHELPEPTPPPPPRPRSPN